MLHTRLTLPFGPLGDRIPGRVVYKHGGRRRPHIQPDPMSIKLSTEDLGDIMETAGMSCTYWADEIEVDGDDVRVLDADGTDYDTDKASIERAFTLIAEGRVDLWAEIRLYVESAISENDLGWIDSYAADALLQVALFGEIIYG